MGDTGYSDSEIGTRRDGSDRRYWTVSTQSRQFSECEGSEMSDIEARTELFGALRELSEIAPEMRVGQLIAAVGELCADLHGRGLWDASDAELLEAVWQFRRNFEAATVTTEKR